MNEAHSRPDGPSGRRLFELAEEIYFAGEGRRAGAVCAWWPWAATPPRDEHPLGRGLCSSCYRDQPISDHVEAIGGRARADTGCGTRRWQVGAATRTIKPKPSKLARKDTTVYRTACSPRASWHRERGAVPRVSRGRVRTKLFSDPSVIIVEQIEAATQERHRRFGDSLYLLQPERQGRRRRAAGLPLRLSGPCRFRAAQRPVAASRTSCTWACSPRARARTSTHRRSRLPVAGAQRAAPVHRAEERPS